MKKTPDREKTPGVQERASELGGGLVDARGRGRWLRPGLVDAGGGGDHVWRTPRALDRTTMETSLEEDVSHSVYISQEVLLYIMYMRMTHISRASINGCVGGNISP